MVGKGDFAELFIGGGSGVETYKLRNEPPSHVLVRESVMHVTSGMCDRMCGCLEQQRRLPREYDVWRVVGLRSVGLGSQKRSHNGRGLRWRESALGGVRRGRQAFLDISGGGLQGLSRRVADGRLLMKNHRCYSICLLIPLLLGLLSVRAEAGWMDTLKKDITGSNAAPVGATSLTQGEMYDGLKQALSKGVQQAVANLGH